MEKKNMQKHYDMVQFLLNIPSRIVQLHGLENITEFVLHDLSSEHCFNFSKVGYFVDNPDFDCFKGVAGYHLNQQYSPQQIIWDDPDLFSSHMKQANFNNEVRKLACSSPKKGSVCEKAFVQEVAQELKFDDPSYFCWKLKHDNHGLVIFEHANGHDHWDQKDLAKGLSLLSLCPIF